MILFHDDDDDDDDDGVKTWSGQPYTHTARVANRS